MAIVKISDLPLVDSPVEGTDLFVVVQDNVTKKAYASDIQTYVGFEEVQYATAGQTVFNLTTMTYAAGANNLQVFVDGVNQYEGLAYQETDNNTVTFTQGLHEGALVKFSTVQTQTSLVNSAGAVTFTAAGAGAVPRSVQSKERDIVSVKDFGAVGNGVVDDTAAIQAAINAHRGKIFFPTGTYVISSTIKLFPERILIGEGAGGYFAGSGYDRLTCLKPTASFSGNDVIRVDPADVAPLLVYSFGVAIRDMMIDCINIKNSSKDILKLLSLSNSETFDSVRIINNNSNVGIRIGVSANVPALECDGLSFLNIYCLQCDAGGSSTTPVLAIESANEVSFRDSKFQRGSNPATAVGSKAVFISAVSNRSVNSVTFESCSFAGGEVGLRIQGNNADGQGPRWIRALNCTFEGPKYPVYISGTATRAAQFNVIGPGNRNVFLAAGGQAVTLDAYSNNNTVFADELTDVVCGTNSQANTIYGGGTVTLGGTNNVNIRRDADTLRLSRIYTQPFVAPTLLNSWTNAANRQTAGYLKTASGFVNLKGTLTGGTYGTGAGNIIFTLPAGHRPSAAAVFSVAAGGAHGEVIIDGNGNVYPAVGSGDISLDGISFVAA